MIFDGKVNIFSINDNQLSTTPLKKEKIFRILKLIFSILQDDLLYYANINFQSF